MAHIGNAPFGKTVRTVTTETLTSVKTAFYPTGGYIVGYVDVYVNGVRLTEAADFTATDGTTVTLLYNPSIGDTVDVVTYGSIELANAVRRDGDTLVGTLFTRALVPTANVTYDIGTSTMRYKDLYLSGNTINLGDIQLTANSTSFKVSNTTGGTFPSALANTTITGTLTANATTITGNVSVTGNTTLTGTLTANATTITGNVSVTGNTILTGTIADSTPMLSLVATGANSTSFNWISTAIANTLPSNGNIISLLGQGLSLKNSGYIGYKHSAAGSNSNILTFGLYGIDNVLNINGQARVGIGNTAPEEKLHVTGSIKAGTKVQNGAYEPSISLSAPGAGFGNAAVFLNNTTTEADAIIYADYDPYVEWNLAHRNSTDEFIMHSGLSTNSIESSTFYNRAGSARTGYAKFKFALGEGNATIGGKLFVNGQPGFLAYPSTSYNVTSGSITYDAERFDATGSYNTSTYTFTAPVSGRYVFGFSFWAPPSGKAMCKLQINSADWGGMPYPRVKAYDGNDYVYGNASVVVNLSANDNVRVVWVEGTVHINTIYNYFYGYLLG